MQRIGILCLQLTLLFGAILGCTGKPGVPLLGNGASSGSTGGQTTGGTGGASTSTSGSTASGSSGGGTSGTGGTSGGSVCAPGAVWSGSVCVVQSCNSMLFLETCQLGDGGSGVCVGNQCVSTDIDNDSNNCCGYGVSCPPGTTCQQCQCLLPGGGAPPSCVDSSCPDGKRCDFSGRCEWASCDGRRDEQSCVGANPFSYYCCGLNCTLLSLDSANCGACGIACGPGALCVNNVCAPAATCDPAHNNLSCLTSSGADGVCCEGVCTEVGANDQNCGACGRTCPTGASCGFNYCGPDCSDSSCPSSMRCALTGPCETTVCSAQLENYECVGTNDAGSSYLGLCCASACADYLNDPSNCGACGQACANGSFCSNGGCVGNPICGDVSVGTACSTSLGGRGQCCGGSCVDIEHDPQNCGACGLGCATGQICEAPWRQWSQVVCAGADCSSAGCPLTDQVCTPALLACVSDTCAGLLDETLCGGADGSLGVCCAGSCGDPFSDSSNCGGCGSKCPINSACMNGGCVAADGSQSLCAGDGGGCPSGTWCSLGFCLPSGCTGRSPGDPCAFGPGTAQPSFVGTDPHFGGICCGDTCVDPLQDNQNCGGCGTACAGACYLGLCMPATPDDTCLQTCAAGSVCVAGSCVDGECGTGPAQVQRFICATPSGEVGVCCPSLACANLETDPQNCGSCGSVCPAGVSCQAGSCQGCGEGQLGRYCNLDAGSSYLCCAGGCTDTSSDPANCGTCGSPCATGQTCVGGSCE